MSEKRAAFLTAAAEVFDVPVEQVAKLADAFMPYLREALKQSDEPEVIRDMTGNSLRVMVNGKTIAAVVADGEARNRRTS